MNDHLICGSAAGTETVVLIDPPSKERLSTHG